MPTTTLPSSPYCVHPRGRRPGYAAALCTLQMRSTHLAGFQGHGTRKSKHVASPRPWTGTSSWRGSQQAPARRTWLAPKARQAPKHTPAMPAPPAASPIPLHSIPRLCRRCRCRSFQEHTFDRKINKNRHHQSRRPTTPPLRRWTAGGDGRALLPWSGLSRVIAIQESSETTTCSAAAAQHAICGRPMWPSNLVCSAALRYKTGPRYLRCGKRQLVRGAPPSAYHIVRLQPHLCCRTPTWYLQWESVYADGDSS